MPRGYAGKEFPNGTKKNVEKEQESEHDYEDKEEKDKEKKKEQAFLFVVRGYFERSTRSKNETFLCRRHYSPQPRVAQRTLGIGPSGMPITPKALQQAATPSGLIG